MVAKLVNEQGIDLGEIRFASTFWRRFRGLQLQASMPAEQVLMLVPCRSVHTHFMRFAIDLVACDRQGQVVDVRHDVKPWKVVPLPRQTYCVLEARSAGCLRGVSPNQRLRILATDSRMTIPKPLWDWRVS